MIDKIWEMILKEARSKPGDSIHAKVDLVLMEISIKLFEFFEEFDSHMYDDMPSEDELEKAHSPIVDAWIKKKRQERSNGRL